MESVNLDMRHRLALRVAGLLLSAFVLCFGPGGSSTRTHAQAPGDPAQVGEWSAPFQMPIVAVHTVLLRSGEVLMWDALNRGRNIYVRNPATGTFAYSPSASNLFCAAQTMLADGSVLVAGGHNEVTGFGITDVNRFDPATHAWSVAAPMAFPRWYPTATTLGDGRVLVVSGATTCFTCLVEIPEVYDPATDHWTTLDSARLYMPMYPHMFVLPDGRVLYASASEATVVTRALDLATQTWTTIDPVVVPGGSSVMYRPGVVLKAGSPGAPKRIAPDPSRNTAYVLDMNNSIAAWERVSDMAFGRTYHVLTLLPDGNVLAAGGVVQNDDPKSAPVLAAEIFDATTRTWSTMASGQVPRSYHTTSTLLPDGRVLIAGSGGWTDMENQFNGEIFSPPYLFKGPRPRISAAPRTVSYGSSFAIEPPDGGSIASVALIRLPAVTHAIDMNQRYVSLAFAPTADGTGLTAQAPAYANLAPPGDYMLFVINTKGVPSVASFLTVSSDTTPPVITSVAASDISSSGTKITWTTDEPSDSRVDYGPTTGYGSATPLDTTPVTAHAVTLDGLAPGTAYHYRIRSRDAAGNLGTSADYAFTTAGTPPYPTQSPYTGTPFAVPGGQIEAEDFDNGGEGVAYHDNVPGNAGGIYRPDEDVDIISPYAGGFVVNNFEDGEWLEYGSNVPQAGVFPLETLASSEVGGSRSPTEIDG